MRMLTRIQRRLDYVSQLARDDRLYLKQQIERLQSQLNDLDGSIDNKQPGNPDSVIITNRATLIERTFSRMYERVAEIESLKHISEAGKQGSKPE